MDNIEYLKKYLDSDKLDEGIKRLEQGEPVQYIVGNVNFYGNVFKVNKNVLIPRFETEELIEKTLKYFNDKNKAIKIVDLGTGSGCVAITLKKELPNSTIDAVDISIDALEVAKENAKLNNVDINFYHGNMLEPLSNKYDLIISNPPYIDRNEPIMDIVKNNEPELALYADNAGLYYYEYILKNISDYLNDDYLIAFEIGYKQGQKIVDLCNKYLPNSKISIEKDLSDKDRFAFITPK